MIQEDEGERIVTEYDVDPFRLSDKQAPLFWKILLALKLLKKFFMDAWKL